MTQPESEAPSIEQLMADVWATLEADELASEQGIDGAHRQTDWRIGLLTYAMLFAINDVELQDLPEKAILQKWLTKLGNTTSDTRENTGYLATAGYHLYAALTNTEDAQPFYDALWGLLKRDKLI